ncbi:hypothetical protein G9A89_012243 [Geosiphon pyriformis]|nr:hypothetical protein G9A89_012243 [Geosiphon pyriformis]
MSSFIKTSNPTHVLVKYYFKQFIIRVHPDFFHNYPFEKQVNATSLQTLNQLVKPLSDFKHGSLASPKPVTDASAQLKFYYRDNNSEGLKLLEWNLHSSAVEFSDTRGILSRWHILREFMTMCSRIGIKVDVNHELLAEESIVRISTELKTGPKGGDLTAAPHPPSQKSISQIFAEELRSTIPQNLNLIDHKNPINYKLLLNDSTLNKFARSNHLLFFSSALNWAQRRIALQSLYSCVFEHSFSQYSGADSFSWWAKFPIIVIPKDDDRGKEGIFLMLYDCSKEVLLENISQNFARLKLEYQTLVSTKCK